MKKVLVATAAGIGYKIKKPPEWWPFINSLPRGRNQKRKRSLGLLNKNRKADRWHR